MDFLKVVIIIAFVVLTVLTIKIHPEMHQPMLLEDADFVLTRVSDTITADNIPVTNVSNAENKKVVEISVPEQKESAQKAIEIYNRQQEQPVVKYVQTQDVKPVTAKKEIKVREIPNNASQIELLQRVMKNAENSSVVKHPEETKTTKYVNTDTQKTTTKTKTVDIPKTPANTQQKTVKIQPAQPKSSSNPYMTEEEEIIAWNVWRSNIQNQIMKDSNIDFAPYGTVFTFTFIVDKFGNVSNIKVECSHPSFMDVARNNVKPAISNLQKKPILNFPRGTKRTSTVVQGMFLIGTQTRYSTPDNYSDFERVVR